MQHSAPKHTQSETGESLLTVIAARGGSKGLPRKNARILGDAPLFAWSYFAWRQSGLPGVCWLSTDDEEIARLGAEWGVDVPFVRPAILANDEATALDVALHAIAHYKAINAAEPEWYLLLQPTSPLRPAAVLSEAWKKAQSPEVDAVLGVKPLFRSLSSLYRTNSDGELQPVEQAPLQSRRQDVRPLLTPNGALYLVRTAALRNEGTFVPVRTIPLLMDAIGSIDIDDASDWRLAEAVVKSGAHWREQPIDG